MSDLYWMTVLGNLENFFLSVSIILGVLLSISVMGILANAGINERSVEKCRKYSKRILPGFIFFLISLIFIPSKKEMYLIYGVGGTIDYLKANPTAKQLPNKCIEVIDKWLDEKKDEE